MAEAEAVSCSDKGLCLRCCGVLDLQLISYYQNYLLVAVLSYKSVKAWPSASLQGKVGILSCYWTFFCSIVGFLFYNKYFDYYFLFIYLFTFFGLPYYNWSDFSLKKKNSDRHLFSVKCKYKSVIVILYFNFSIFSTNSWHFFYCVTTSIFTKQCNSRWNTSNHQVEQKKKKKRTKTDQY